MIIHDHEQGSHEWYQVRLGIPTASRCSEILTPKTLKLSTQSRGYMAELIAERYTGKPADEGNSQWMQRGTELESQARAAYARQTGWTVQTVGFISLDDGSFGASCDGLVGDDGLVEIKCRGLKTVFAYLMDSKPLVDACWSQVQGQLFVTGREWCDIFAWHPEPTWCTTERIERDEKYILALAKALVEFNEEMESRVAALRERGIYPASEQRERERAAAAAAF